LQFAYLVAMWRIGIYVAERSNLLYRRSSTVKMLGPNPSAGYNYVSFDTSKLFELHNNFFTCDENLYLQMLYQVLAKL
jgi:hypothetical protein